MPFHTVYVRFRVIFATFQLEICHLRQSTFIAVRFGILKRLKVCIWNMNKAKNGDLEALAKRLEFQIIGGF